jgi:diadenylate cyclase
MHALLNFRWQDGLEIVLLTVVFYRLFLLIQGTRAVQMLLGLLVVFAVATAAPTLGFHTITWIFSNFLAVFVTAVIVLFQPELRRALATMGRAPLVRRFTGTARLQVLEELVRASIHLAGKRIGALIVLQRETEVSGYVEAGIPLDARVSRELLTSIFLPNSPIHDGAVVIKDDRVLMAGAFLPVSLDPRISKELGTRHRAAVGVSEETDAVVIVVSEETGAISLVTDGRLHANLDGQDLRERLQGLFLNRGRD